MTLKESKKKTMALDNLIQKFYMEYVDKAGEVKVYQQENISAHKNGLRYINLPFDINTFSADQLTVRLYSTADKYTEIKDIGLFQYLVTGGKSDDENKNYEYKEKVEDDVILKDIASQYFKQTTGNSFPHMVYSDVTEKEMFGYEAIDASKLKSIGLWGMHGFRIFEIRLENYEFTDSSDLERTGNLYWNHIDSKEIEKIFEERIEFDQNKKTFYIYINTNALQEAISENNVESHCPTFRGYFEIHDKYKDHGRYFKFPLEICVHDVETETGRNSIVNTSMVSIDFGTSATCAAVPQEGNDKLFTLSGPDKRDTSDGDNAYENPTNIMIYRWDEVYKQWSIDNDNYPFFRTKSNEIDERHADYDSGYKVEDEYKDVDAEDGRRKMVAIIKHLKSIPYWLSHGREHKFVPYWSKNRSPISITDTLEDMGGTKFNPIAFYGYLLGRAINMPENGKVYTKYQITYPVKFDKEVCEKIRSSLEYGIKRALPRSIREATKKNGKPLISVSMKYSEPVACIGAIVGRQLKITPADPAAKLFAIYDLGGGTMDFAFGMFRKAVGDEEEQADQVIELLGIDGDEKIGGEKLIHKLAYKIYKDSKADMENNNIKFVLPEGELYPEGFDGLLSETGDEIADSNVNSIKEKLARILFKHSDPVDNVLTNIFGEDKEIVPDATHFKLPLRGKNGEDIDGISLEVKNVDEFLEKEIAGTIAAFKEKMNYFFKKHENKIKKAEIKSYKTEDVRIFLGGNASKQHWVEALMQKEFKRNTIERIGDDSSAKDTGSEAEISNEYKVNEKTAVAFGQLHLGSYVVNEDAIKAYDELPPFGFYVGYIDSGSDEFKPVLDKNETKRGWAKANRVDVESGQTNLYYTASTSFERKSLKPLIEDVSEFVEADKRTLYIRVHEEDSIEFRIGTQKVAPEGTEAVNQNMILKLRVLD